MKFSLTLLAAVIFAFAFAACEGPCAGLSGSEAKQCVAKELARSDKLLNDVYRKLHKELKEEYKDDKNVSEKVVKQRLIETERAWIEFRNAECAFQAGKTTQDAGPDYELAHTKCMLMMTEKRLIDLETYLEEIE